MGNSKDLVPIAAFGGLSAILFGTEYFNTVIFKTFGHVSGLVGFLIGVAFYHGMQFIRWELIRQLLTYRDWMYHQKGTKTKIWGILLSFFMPKKNKLFDLQNYLPRYPLPKLKDTCKKTLEMVQPLLNDAEFKAVCEAMSELENNEGPSLQNILQKRYDTEENWLSELWDKYAYLAGRNPIPVHSNFCTLGDFKHKESYPNAHQLSQAANSIHFILEYNEKVKRGAIRNMMIQGMIPICCDRYKYICSTTRIPKEDIDELKRYPESRHIVVFRKGSMYKLDMYGKDVDGNCSLLTPREIQTLLEDLVQDADSKAAQATSQVTNPSVFTCTNRKAWAKIRENMLQNDINACSLEAVESSVFCVALDTDNPKTSSEEFHLYLTGNGFNRWFDKSLTLIIEENERFGLNVEHTTAEATISGRMFEYSFYYTKFDSNGDAIHCGLPEHDVIPKPQYLQWELDSYQDDITRIKGEFKQLESDVDAEVFIVNKGKSFMKKLRLSPDGFMQMALQLAFYRLHKETPKTYETAATRLFKLGRTETIRSVSKHSVAFTKAFDDPSVPPGVIISHLKKAILHQTRYKYDAMNGLAVDRHLFGLYLAGKLSGSVPRLFTLKPFNEYDRLSTSQSPLKYDPVIAELSKTDPVGGGFGAQRPDGYGVSYFMAEHKVNFLISSFRSCRETGSMLFANAIQQAVDDMKELLESNQSGMATSSDVKSNGMSNGKI